MQELYDSPTDIYEHGIAVTDGEPPASLQLIATTKLPIYAHFNLSIVDFDGRSLNERAARLATVAGPHWNHDYFEEYDLRFFVLATLYHLNRLIDIYVAVSRSFESIHPPGTALKGSTDEPRAYYEIQALVRKFPKGI